MHRLGEPNTITIGKNGRLCDTGITTTCLRYPDGHAGDVYCKWNQRINQHSEIRDVIWLNPIFFKKKVEDCERNQIVMAKSALQSDYALLDICCLLIPRYGSNH